MSIATDVSLRTLSLSLPVTYAAHFPPDMAEYFNARWTPRQLWNIDLPTEAIQIAELDWHLDYPFWPSDPPGHIFDLRPRAVLEARAVHPGHYERILAADTRYPLEVGVFGSSVVILDGIHRLAKLVREGASEVHVRTSFASL